MSLPRKYYQMRAEQAEIGRDPENVWHLFAFQGYTKILALYIFLPWIDGDWQSYRTATPPVLPRPEKRQNTLPLRKLFGPLILGTLMLRAAGWTIWPLRTFCITPPVTTENGLIKSALTRENCWE